MTSASFPVRAPQATDVLFVTHNFPRSRDDFAGRFIWLLARELIQLGASVAVVAPHHPGAKEEETWDGINIIRFRYGRDDQEVVAYRGDLDRWSGSSPVSVGATLRFLRAFKRATVQAVECLHPRVVHAHWWVPGGWAARAPVRKHRIKFILTSHGTDIRMLEGQRWLRFPARRVFRSAHEITTVSTWLKEQISRWFPEVAPRITVVPMPVDRGPFTPGTPPNNEIPIVLSVARFTEQKRLFDLMNAAHILKSRGRPVRFRFIGAGPLEKELHDRKYVKGIADEIAIVPIMPADQLAQEYRRADVVVLCSVDEGFGMTLVEAQLCGRPVIGTRSGGITDIIEDGRSGILVEPRNPGALADAIEYLLVDAAERERLARVGLQSAQERFNPTTVAATFVDLYQLS